VLNIFLPHDAFEIALNFSALGIICMWTMIMICNLALQRAARAGRVVRPAHRLPFAPYTNYLTIAFLVVVFVLSWFDVPAGRIMIYGSPGVAALLVIGWFLVRDRVRRTAAHNPR
jgi:L-asparagine permease